MGPNEFSPGGPAGPDVRRRGPEDLEPPELRDGGGGPAAAAAAQVRFGGGAVESELVTFLGALKGSQQVTYKIFGAYYFDTYFYQEG